MKRLLILTTFLMTLLLAAGPAWSGPSSGGKQDFNLAALVVDYVRDQANRPPEDMRIEFPAKPPEVTLEGERISCDVSPLGKTTLIGNCRFIVRFFDGGVFIEKYQVRADIEVLERYVTAARVVKRDTIVGAADLQTSERWVRRFSMKSVADVDEIMGKRLTVDLVPDREVTRAMIKEPILVKRGDVVRIVLDSGPLSLIATGVAEEAGVDRQRIRVKNLSSQRVILAKVVGEAFVRVETF
ncbi:MAG: flagellar basal body P-ring formation chaperone FlgA [Syntrophales bacterium]|nr:flagellar basal body P-ring formation chaperone FlgA [Syntrophales bacterium]